MVVHVAGMRKIKAYNILVWKIRKKSLLGRYRIGWKHHIEIYG
jgi:hypothetical protein